MIFHEMYIYNIKLLNDIASYLNIDEKEFSELPNFYLFKTLKDKLNLTFKYLKLFIDL